MFSTGAKTITAGATVSALLLAAATPSYAEVPGALPPSPGVSVGASVTAGPVQVQGQVQVTPPGAQPYQGYPQAYPQPYPQPYQGYPQGYPQAYPQPYPPGYSPAYPQGYPPPLLQPYQQAQKVPIRYETKPMTSLIIAGAITFGGSYLMTALITGYAQSLSCSGTSSCSGTYWPLYVPVAGPFIYLGAGDKGWVTYGWPLFALSGIAQVGGLAMLIAGAAIRRRVPVYAEEPPRVSVAPYFSPVGGGMQAVVKF